MDGRPWHRAQPERLEELRKRLADTFPELHVVERDETIVIKGVYPLIDGGKVVDRYRIEIDLPKAYPKGTPILRETGGRIPRAPARHVDADGSACLFVPDQFCYEHPDGMDLIEFLNGPVLGFLVGQSLVERGQRFPFGERSHGAAGIIEFYREILGTSELRVIVAHVEILAAKKLRGHWTCPCGSGARIRECCHSSLVSMRARIPRSVAKRSLVRLKEPTQNNDD